MSHPVRVLLVDDSPFLRHILTRRLEADAGIAVVGHAVDGQDALDKVSTLAPDVVILDVEMPRMDGLTALQRIMAECPTPVVMLSARTQRGARTTIQALIRGAVDFVPKPANDMGLKSIVEELAAKVKVAASTPLSSLASAPARESLRGPQLGPGPWRSGDPIVVVGASTGGPRALQQMLSGLPADLSAAVVVVQHMPAEFIRSLAQRLNENMSLTVKEAAAGERLARRLVLLAPGDHHLQLGRDGRVRLDQGPPRNHVRPSIDVTMESAAEHCKSSTIGVVLTGMGSDGTAGAGRIKAAGGQVIAEHESTCVVYGMPRSVIEAGLADRVVPLPRIAASLVELVSEAQA